MDKLLDRRFGTRLHFRYYWFFLISFLAALAMACGGGGSDSPLIITTPTPTPVPAATPTPVPLHLAICAGDFALCAAATCAPTGGTITLNNGKVFPAASCLCPVLSGLSIADLSGGNMQGSCAPPDKEVWSTYAVESEIPQEAATPPWSAAPGSLLLCPAGDQFAECWSFSCTLASVVNGVQLAQCTCPIETGRSQFISQAGLGGAAACSELPIGAAFPENSAASAAP